MPVCTPLSSAHVQAVPVAAVVISAVLAMCAITWALVRWRAPSPARRGPPGAQNDTEPPLQAWARAAFSVVTGDVDYGQLPRAEARQMLIHWWEVYGPRELTHALRELSNAGRPDNAWDLLRFIVVMRLGAAAQYVGARQAWDETLPVAQRLQATYRTWPEMAQAYVVARRQWKGIATDGSEDDDGMRRILDNIAAVRDDAWAHVPWNCVLTPPPNGTIRR